MSPLAALTSVAMSVVAAASVSVLTVLAATVAPQESTDSDTNSGTTVERGRETTSLAALVPGI